MTLSPILTKSYVEQRDSGYWVGSTRISLDSVVNSFLAGDSPETIAQNFSAISLEEAYGAIAFYLANKALVDDYISVGEADFEELRDRCSVRNPALHRKLKYSQRRLSVVRQPLSFVKYAFYSKNRYYRGSFFCLWCRGSEYMDIFSSQ